jgi:hypothetical protein
VLAQAPRSDLRRRHGHDVDRGSKHHPQAQADQQEAGHEGDDTRPGRHQAEQEADAGQRDDEAPDDQRSLRALPGESLRTKGRNQDAEGGRREDDARLDGVVPADGLQVDGDDERRAHENEPLRVLRDKAEIGRAVLEQSGGEQRFLTGSLSRADVERERGEEGGSDREEHRHEQDVAVGLQDPQDDEEHADSRQNRPHERAKLQMNWVRASGSRDRRRATPVGSAIGIRLSAG